MLRILELFQRIANVMKLVASLEAWSIVKSAMEMFVIPTHRSIVAQLLYLVLRVNKWIN